MKYYEIGIGHQRLGNHQTPHHAAGQLPDHRVAPVCELGKLKEPAHPLQHIAPRQAEIATVDENVLRHRQVRVQVVVLGHHPHPGRRGPVFGIHGCSKHLQFSTVQFGQAHNHSQCRRFTGSVGSEDAETLPGLDGEIDTVNRLFSGIPFAQSPRRNHCRHTVLDFRFVKAKHLRYLGTNRTFYQNLIFHLLQEKR